MKLKTELRERKEKEIKSWVSEEMEKINKPLVRPREKKMRVDMYMDTHWGRVGRMNWEMELTHIHHRYSE